jgi:hypothetical protein
MNYIRDILSYFLSILDLLQAYLIIAIMNCHCRLPCIRKTASLTNNKNGGRKYRIRGKGYGRECGLFQWETSLEVVLWECMPEIRAQDIL